MNRNNSAMGLPSPNKLGLGDVFEMLMKNRKSNQGVHFAEENPQNQSQISNTLVSNLLLTPSKMSNLYVPSYSHYLLLYL